jgi:cell division ATPase FtsA
MSKESKNLIVGLDIGTSKVVAIVAELLPDNRLNIIGMGGHESKGLKKGVVVNIEATVNAIQRALEEAELMADCKIARVFTGIAGSHIKSFNSRGMVAIKDKEVSALDVRRVIETARALPIPTDQQILHILTQQFIATGAARVGGGAQVECIPSPARYPARRGVFSLRDERSDPTSTEDERRWARWTSAAAPRHHILRDPAHRGNPHCRRPDYQ